MSGSSKRMVIHPHALFLVKIEIQSLASCSRSAISKFAKGVTDVFHRDSQSPVLIV